MAKKLLVFPSATDFLTSDLGFARIQDDADETSVFEISANRLVDVASMQSKLNDVNSALAKLEQNASTSTSTTATATTNKPAAVKEKLSEKQKARLLMEKKKADEKKLDQAHRQKNLKQLQEDEHARRHDPNWKSGVSSACSKAGSSISTFRDKYGE